MHISDCQKAIDITCKIRVLKANLRSLADNRAGMCNVRISGATYPRGWPSSGQPWEITYPMNVTDVCDMMAKDIAALEKQLFDLGVKADA